MTCRALNKMQHIRAQQYQGSEMEAKIAYGKTNERAWHNVKHEMRYNDA
jgi:hypothetical protein